MNPRRITVGVECSVPRELEPAACVERILEQLRPLLLEQIAKGYPDGHVAILDMRQEAPTPAREEPELGVLDGADRSAFDALPQEDRDGLLVLGGALCACSCAMVSGKRDAVRSTIIAAARVQDRLRLSRDALPFAGRLWTAMGLEAPR